MTDGFWIVMAIIAVVVCYTVAKVFSYVRKSERQWEEVDKTKLEVWDDDEEW